MSDELRLSEFLPYQLVVLANRISRDFSRRYREEFGLSIPEWRVLAHLAQAKEPLSVREIHQRVDMDKSKISRAAARLERNGLVTKRENPQDRRLVDLELTEAGRDLYAAITPIALDFQAELLSKLPDEEGRHFRRLVRALLDATEPASQRRS